MQAQQQTPEPSLMPPTTVQSHVQVSSKKDGKKPLDITVYGAGPVGLTFAIATAEWAILSGHNPDTLQIQIYEVRTLHQGDDGKYHWPSTTDLAPGRSVKNRRREQIVTLQHATLQLMDSLKPETRCIFEGDHVWKHSENVVIRDLEDRLLSRAQDDDMRPFIHIHPVPSEVHDIWRSDDFKLDSADSEPPSKRFFRSLNCDIIVGADGGNSQIRKAFRTEFDLQEPIGTDYVVGMAFENMEGWTAPNPALNVCITLAQNMYQFNPAQGGRRGYVHVRLTQNEFKTLQEHAGAPCKFAKPCELYDIMKVHDSRNIPIYDIDPRLRAKLIEGLSCFGIPERLLSSLVLFKVEPRYVNKFHIQEANKVIALIGDAAMNTHFWHGRGLNTGIRAAVALSWDVQKLLCHPVRRVFHEQFDDFADYMTQLRKEEIDKRSGAMFHHQMIMPDVGHDVQAALGNLQANSVEMEKRIMDWRDFMEREEQRHLLHSDVCGGQECRLGWPHAHLSDEVIKKHCIPLKLPSPTILAAMVKSGFRNSAGPCGWVLSHRPAELLPEEPDWCGDAQRNVVEAVARRQAIGRDREANWARQREKRQIAISAEKHEEKNRAERDMSPHESYDFVLEIDKFFDVNGDGWKVLKNEVPNVPDDDGILTRAVVLGNFKRGKTWLLEQLSKAKLPCNVVRHTPGICSKRINVKGGIVELMDVKGENTAISFLGKKELQEKKAEESFIRDVACSLADRFVYVVGQVGYQEQLTLTLLVDELDKYVEKRRKTTPYILMVHNLKNISNPRDLEDAWEEIKSIYIPDGHQALSTLETDPVTGEDVRVHYLHKPLQAGTHSGVQVVHFYLGQEHTPAAKHNAATIQALRTKLLSDFPQRHGSFPDELLKEMSARIQSLLITSDKVEVKLVDGPDRLLLQRESSPDAENLEDAAHSIRPVVSLRDMHLGDFVNCENPPQSKIRFRVTSTQNNKIRAMIEIPGANYRMLYQSLFEKGERRIPIVRDQWKLPPMPDDQKPLILTRMGAGVQMLVRPGMVDRGCEVGEKLAAGGFDTDPNAELKIPIAGPLEDWSRLDFSYENGVVTLEWELKGEDQFFPIEPGPKRARVDDRPAK